MRKAALLLASVVVLVACATAPEDAAFVESNDQEIIGGSPMNAYPAVGALTINGQAFCTATLIGKREVLTAAHCVLSIPQQYHPYVRFATGANAGDPDSIYEVASMKAHSGFSFQVLVDDIGLVTLKTDAAETPIPPNSSMDSSFVGQNLLFVGYGVSDGVNQTGSGTKRAVTMPVNGVGSKTFRYGVAGRKNTCNGDSGGPALYVTSNGAAAVAGVTSYGDKTCANYGVDTRVDAYLSWLGQAPAGSAQSKCGSETFAGRCNGNTLVWCDSDVVKQANCSSNGDQCGWNSGAGYNDCI